MRALLIAEKPSLMRDIRDVYSGMSHPDQIDFSAFVGHVVELKSPEEYKDEWGKPWRLSVLPMIPDTFQYKVKKSVKDVYKDVKDKLNSGYYDYVINACDAGREGELIFYAFYKTVGCKLPVKRLWASDTTEDTMREALLNLIDDKEPSLVRLKASAQYRAYFDWLMGMNLSRAITLKTKQMIPVGRVMTPTLGIVVKRELEILNFKPTDYWQLEADFGDYKGLWFDEKTGDNKLLDKTKAESLKKGLSKDGEVQSVDKQRKKNFAPTLHSLLELQKEANKVYGYSAQETLDIAQELYQTKKLISYPRTESRYLPKNLAGKLPQHLKALESIDEVKDIVKDVLNNTSRMNEIMNSKKYVDDKKVTDHHAIIPTTTKPNLSSLSTKEKNIYMLVVKRLLAIFMDPFVVDKTIIITKVDNELFKTTGSTVVELGYMELYKNAMRKSEEAILPKLKKGDAVKVKSYKLLTKQTTPPSRYDDSSLLQAMANAGGFIDDEELQTILKETAGLGTSATRAGIIEKLVERKMIGKKGKSYYATQFGIDIIQTLNGRDITSPELTAVWELKLSQIEDGTFSPKDFYQQMIQYTTEVTKDIMDNVNQSINQQAEDKMVGNCPKCNATVAEGKSYYLCKNYKDTCDFILPKEFCGAKLTKTEIKKLLAGKETKELSFTFKSGKSGKGKLVIGTDGKLTFANNANRNAGNTGGNESTASSNGRKVIGTCPVCSKNVVVSDKYFLCEDYKNPCSFLVGKTFLGANITETDMKALLSGKETKEKEFTWKSGKKGKAKLKWNGKLEFVFSN